MAGASTADLTVAISEAGGMGPLAAAALSPEAIRNEVATVRKRTSKPFNINLFVLGQAKADPQQVARALELLAPIREELGLAPGTPLEKYCPDNAAQMEAVLEARPALASFTFGILSKEQVAAFQARGILVMGTADYRRGSARVGIGGRGFGLRARIGSGRASRHVFGRCGRISGGNDGAGAANGGCGAHPGDCGRRNHGWPRHRRRADARSRRRADGHRVSEFAGVWNFGGVARSAARREG
jgi:hypothetical protein